MSSSTNLCHVHALFPYALQGSCPWGRPYLPKHSRILQPSDPFWFLAILFCSFWCLQKTTANPRWERTEFGDHTPKKMMSWTAIQNSCFKSEPNSILKKDWRPVKKATPVLDCTPSSTFFQRRFRQKQRLTLAMTMPVTCDFHFVVLTGISTTKCKIWGNRFSQCFLERFSRMITRKGYHYLHTTNSPALLANPQNVSKKLNWQPPVTPVTTKRVSHKTILVSQARANCFPVEPWTNTNRCMPTWAFCQGLVACHFDNPFFKG